MKAFSVSPPLGNHSIHNTIFKVQITRLQVEIPNFVVHLRDGLPEKLFEMLQLLSYIEDKKKGLECLELLFRYLVQATDKLSKEDFQKALSAIPEKGDSMPTLAEQSIEEGESKRRASESKPGM